MIKITLEDITYELAESWDELTFLKYIDILNLGLDKMNSPTLSMIKSIASLTDNSKVFEETARRLSNDNLNALFKAFEWLNVMPDYKKYDKDTLEVNGITYRLKKHYHKLTANEVIMGEELNATSKYDLHFMEVAFGMLLRELDKDGNEIDLTLDSLLNTILTLRDKVMLRDVLPLINFTIGGDITSSSNASPSSLPTLKIQKGNTQSKKKTKRVKKV